MAVRKYYCDECGMEFIEPKFDKRKDAMKDGHEVDVMYFTCPKCDREYIVSVFDDESFILRKEYIQAMNNYRESGDGEFVREARKEAEFKKKKLRVYTNKLKKKYLKELRKRG